MKLDKSLGEEVIQVIASMLQDCDASDFNAANIRELSIAAISDMGLKNGQFLSPFRVALTGLARSAGPFEICAILGKAEALKRLSHYL